MAQAARAIIIEGDKLLVMYRNKQGSEYFTLVGGQVAEGEATEQALVREVREETGLIITGAQLVYVEKHAAPYNQQYIYVCQVAPHADVAIQDASEEASMNKMEVNIHKPMWTQVSTFDKLPFRTPQLQAAILHGLRKGFPAKPVDLSQVSYMIKDQPWHAKLTGLPGNLRRSKRR